MFKGLRYEDRGMHRGYVGAVCLAIVMIAATAAQARDWTARLGGGVAISKPVGAAALSASPIQISQLDLLGRWRLQHRLSAEARVALQFHHHLSPLASLFASTRAVHRTSHLQHHS